MSPEVKSSALSRITKKEKFARTLASFIVAGSFAVSDRQTQNDEFVRQQSSTDRSHFLTLEFNAEHPMGPFERALTDEEVSRFVGNHFKTAEEQRIKEAEEAKRLKEEAVKKYLLAPVSSSGVRAAALDLGEGVWEVLANCEAGGAWSANTGNGFYGGLQFDEGTWLSYGGGEYAPFAHLASKDQQIEIAKRVRDSGRGYNPWPGCADLHGLR